jgi:hypothetical protein
MKEADLILRSRFERNGVSKDDPAVLTILRDARFAGSSG